MARNDPQRQDRIVSTLQALQRRGIAVRGYGRRNPENAVQSRLAEHFGVSRQRINQLAREVEET